MRPQLIVDFSDRTLFAVVVTAEGQVVPCSQEVRQVATRYLSTEILFDPRPTEDPDFLWEEALEILGRTDARSLFQRARRFGLRRPWDAGSFADALRLPSPLSVLSSPAALVDPVVQPVLPGVAIVLLEALLSPVFSFLAQGHPGMAGIADAVVVIPACTGRQARLALHRIFRRHGFRRLTLLPREIAASLMLLEEGPAEYLVWDVTGEDLQLHRVAIESMEGVRRIRTVAARTVRGLGWPCWVQRIALALAGQERVSMSPGALVPSLDRALMGLLGVSHDSAELPGSPSLRLSHGLLDEVLESERCPGLLPDLQASAGPQLDALGAHGLPTILLGTACGLRRFQDLFLSIAGGWQPPAVAQQPMPERTTRGVVAALLWLRSQPGSMVELPPSGGLRLDTFHGEACEILPAEHLPAPGEEGYLRRCFHFAGEGGATGPFLVHLLWGSDVAPEGNANLGTVPLEVGPGRGALWLTLHLRRSVSGRRLDVTAEACLDDEGTQAPARMFVAQDFPSPLRGEA